MTETDRVAREVSWLTSMLLLSLTVVTAPALLWVVWSAPQEVSQMAVLSAFVLSFLTLGTYTIHMLKYNSLFRRRVEWLLHRLGYGDPDDRVDGVE